jgi:hypothetical protein
MDRMAKAKSEYYILKVEKALLRGPFFVHVASTVSTRYVPPPLYFMGDIGNL